MAKKKESILEEHDLNENLEASLEEIEASLEEKQDGGQSIENNIEEEFEASVKELNKQIEELQNEVLRARADSENVRRRTEKELVSARKYAVESFAKELTSVLDSFDQALKSTVGASDDPVITNMQEGMKLTYKQLSSVMEKFGVVEIKAEAGVKFDADFHLAVGMVEHDEIKDNHIVDVMQKGFLLKDRLLRAAMVTISKKK